MHTYFLFRLCPIIGKANLGGLNNKLIFLSNTKIPFYLNIQEASLEWTGYAQSYRKFKKMNTINSFRVSVESLKEYCEFYQANVFLQARTKISIKVAVWRETNGAAVPSLEEEVYEEVDLFGQSTPHDPDLSKEEIQYEYFLCFKSFYSRPVIRTYYASHPIFLQGDPISHACALVLSVSCTTYIFIVSLFYVFSRQQAQRLCSQL